MSGPICLPFHRLLYHKELQLERAMYHSESIIFELKVITGWDVTHGEWVSQVEKKRCSWLPGQPQRQTLVQLGS